MRRSFWTAAFLAAMLAAIPSHAAAAGRGAALFASERVGGKWSRSFFASLPDDSYAPGVCEEVLLETFASAGFEVPAPPFGEETRLEAKKLRTVFQRYHDLGTLPNDTAALAAGAVMPAFGVVVLCGANTSVKKAKKGRPAAVCAEAACRAIDAGSRQRVATSLGRRCDEGADPREAALSAVRAACREAGSTMAQNLAVR